MSGFLRILKLPKAIECSVLSGPGISCSSQFVTKRGEAVFLLTVFHHFVYGPERRAAHSGERRERHVPEQRTTQRMSITGKCNYGFIFMASGNIGE